MTVKAKVRELLDVLEADLDDLYDTRRLMEVKLSETLSRLHRHRRETGEYIQQAGEHEKALEKTIRKLEEELREMPQRRVEEYHKFYQRVSEVVPKE